MSDKLKAIRKNVKLTQAFLLKFGLNYEPLNDIGRMLDEMLTPNRTTRSKITDPNRNTLR